MTGINETMERSVRIEMENQKDKSRTESLQGSVFQNEANSTNPRFQHVKIPGAFCCANEHSPLSLCDVMVVALLVFVMWTVIVFMTP